MLIEQLIPFAEFLRTRHQKSTRYSYTSRTRTFLRTLSSDAEFTETFIRAYISRMGDKRRPATCGSALASIRKFGQFLVEVGEIAVNPAEHIKPPRLDKPRRETPTEGQVTAMMEACERIYHPYRKALARAVVFTLVMSAVRRDELLALRTSDIDLLDGAIYIRHGKGDKARVVRPGGACIGALRDYLAVRPGCNTDRLFLLRKGFVMGDQGLRVLLREIASIAGMDGCRAILPHGMRHACATRLRANKVELEEIMEFLGHSDVSTTILYLHRPTERAREIAALTDPRANTPAPIAAPIAPSPTVSPSPRQDQPAERSKDRSFLRLDVYEGGDEKSQPGA
jgi:integrase/recombinase XerD